MYFQNFEIEDGIQLTEVENSDQNSVITVYCLGKPQIDYQEIFRVPLEDIRVNDIRFLNVSD